MSDGRDVPVGFHDYDQHALRCWIIHQFGLRELFSGLFWVARPFRCLAWDSSTSAMSSGFGVSRHSWTARPYSRTGRPE